MSLPTKKEIGRAILGAVELTAIMAAEVAVFAVYATGFPPTVPASIGASMFQTLIQVDGILLGFVGAVFGLIAASKQPKSELEQRRVFGFAALTLFVYFVSISISFWALANSANGISPYNFVIPLALSGTATTFFAYATYRSFSLGG